LLEGGGHYRKKNLSFYRQIPEETQGMDQGKHEDNQTKQNKKSFCQKNSMNVNDFSKL